MPRALRRSILATLVAIAGVGCADAGSVNVGRKTPTEPRRVVLFVADGAGVAYWSAALYAADSLALESFPVVGLFDPGNTSHPIPESASSATALATGIRSFYHSVGVGPDSLPRTTVLEAAEDVGLATGFVTTTLLTDATPAARP